jgi:hypothetical protein
MTNDPLYDQGRAFRGKLTPNVYYVGDSVLGKLAQHIVDAAESLRRTAPDPSDVSIAIAASEIVAHRAPQIALDALRAIVQVSDKIEPLPGTKFPGLTEQGKP